MCARMKFKKAPFPPVHSKVANGLRRAVAESRAHLSQYRRIRMDYRKVLHFAALPYISICLFRAFPRTCVTSIRSPPFIP